MKIQIIEDHESMDLAIRILLKEAGCMASLYSAGSITEALEQTYDNTFDIIILDLYLPDGSGEQILDFYSCRSNKPKTLVYSATTNVTVIGRCLRKGACGAICKMSSTNEFLQGIQMAQSGSEPFICSTYSERLNRDRETIDPEVALTSRELEVAKLLSEGRPGKEVANELSISIKTVDKMKASALSKLKLNKSTQLVKYFPDARYY